MHTLFVVLVLRLVALSLELPNPNDANDSQLIEQYPYQVSIRIDKKHACSGSLISSRFVLTASVCTRGIHMSRVTLHVGTHDSELKGDWYLVNTIVGLMPAEPDGTRGTIALIKADQSIKLSNKVKPIEIAPSEIESGTIATLTGWEKNSDTRFHLLRNMNVTVISNEECQKTATVNGNDLCTDIIKSDSVCVNDYGSPLVVNGIQIGLISDATVCDGKHVNVHTNITSSYDEILEWITLTDDKDDKDNKNKTNKGEKDNGNNSGSNTFVSIILITVAIGILGVLS